MSNLERWRFFNRILKKYQEASSEYFEFIFLEEQVVAMCGEIKF